MSNAHFVEQVYAHFAARDMPALQAAFSPDIEWTVSQGFPYGGTYVGFDAIMSGVFAKIAGDWDGFRHELGTMVDCGEDVLVCGTYFGTWKATGRDIEAPFVHHFRIRDGHVQGFHQYVDLPATHAATEGFVHA